MLLLVNSMKHGLFETEKESLVDAVSRSWFLETYILDFCKNKSLTSKMARGMSTAISGGRSSSTEGSSTNFSFERAAGAGCGRQSKEGHSTRRRLARMAENALQTMP